MQRAASLILTLSVLLNACTSWRVAAPAPSATTPTTARQMRVTTRAGTFDVYNARLYPDSVVGNAKNGAHLLFPVGNVLKVEVPYIDDGKTVPLALGAVIFAGLIVWSLSCFASSGGELCY